MNPLLPLALVVPALAGAALLVPVPTTGGVRSGPPPVTTSPARASPVLVGAPSPGQAAHVAVAPPGALLYRPRVERSADRPAVTTAPRGAWTWPLRPQPVVRRRFDPPAHTWSPGHRGVDLAATVGQPVLSAGAGTVSFSGVVAGRGVVTVRHSGGLRTTYEPVDRRPAVGVTVARGGPIGVLATTAGHCAPAACLHWGAVSGESYRDPLSLLDPGHPVLLPLR